MSNTEPGTEPGSEPGSEPGTAPGTAPIEEMRAAVAALTARVEQLEAAARGGTPPLPVELGVAVGVGAPSRSRAGDARAIESRLGGYWAARVGIVSLVTGLAFFVAHGFDRIGPVLKAALGYAIAIALAGFGRWVMRRYPALGRILVAGGLGVAYYTTYAIHYVPGVQLIASPEIAFVLLAGSVLGIIFVAQAMRSETVAGLALFLGLHTGMVSQVGVFTLASSCLLAAGAAYFMARNRWVIVPLSTLVAVYSTLVTWLLGNPLTTAAGVVHPPDHLATALAFVALYYVTFAVAVAAAPPRLPRAAGTSFALLNWTGAALVAAYEITHHHAGGLGIVFALLAATSLALAWLGVRRLGRVPVFHLHLALVAASVALAAWTTLDGAPLILSLCVVGAGSAALARALTSRALGATGAAILAVAFIAHVTTSPDDLVVALALIASLILHERLTTTADRVGRAVAACGVAAVALTTATATVLPPLITVAWVVAAAAIFLLGLRLEAIHYRLVALGVSGLALVRLFLHDLAALSAGYRIASFLIAGALLLGVSFTYTRRHERERDPPG
ncbi:MAG TPA: DUF2339 domain-containing protein [Kofleriaceae bacterium]|nr:DUF2339 domain-containing protein [Kofleriaceae bacterium]